MKTISKKIWLFAGIAVIMLPGAASASVLEDRQAERSERIQERQENRQAKMEERQADRQEKFCENFTSRIEEMQSKLAERKTKFTERKESRAERFEDKRDTRDNALTDKREEQDARRNAWYEKLEDAADTDEKKAALAAFKKTTEDAVEVRRTAVDAAIEAFRDGVDAAVAGKKDTRSTAADAFSAAVTQAIATAKSDCAAGKDMTTVRSAFNAALKTARTNLQSERQESAKLGDTIKDLAAKKKAGIQTALTTFKSTMDQARTDLKKAFGEEAVE